MNNKLPDNIIDCHQTINILQEDVRMLKDAYLELLEYQNKKQFMIDDANLGEFEMDTDSVITKASKGFENLLGYSQGEILGMTFYDLLSEGHDVHTNSYAAFKRTGVVKNLEWKMKKKTGEQIILTLCGRAVYDENGDFLAARGLVADITEKIETTEALRMVEREKAIIMDVMSDCIIYYDTDMRVIWGNKMAALLSGIPANELPGKQCFELCHKNEGFCKGCPLGDPLNTTEPRSGEVKAGDMLFFIMTYPVFDDNDSLIGIVQVIRDITEQKYLEREILDISTRERKEIGNELHDGLGQILTGISFMSNALNTKLKTEAPDSSYVAVNIENQSKKALAMMRGIINGLCPVNEDPQGLMSALERMASDVTSIYGINCEYNCTKSVAIDNYEISNNLFFIAQESVSNALKHSKCKSITICLKKQRNKFRMEIKDDGIGLHTNPKSTFCRGLKIMKYRASMIGADIEYVSKNGEGTSVIVLFNDL